MPSTALPIYAALGAYRQACDEARARGQRVGLVPTMGALHPGHLALVHEARKHADFVAVSIFVNPTQFGPNEDLDKYPRTFEQDVEGCAAAGACCIFAPEGRSMYPEGESTRVRVENLSNTLCGVHRPVHFGGVATVVTKLFVVTGPCVAVFGRKDYQQLKVIERLAKDLLFDVEVVGYRTVREPDGLAMSSRNKYLTQDQRARAAAIPRGLRYAVETFDAGQRKASELRNVVVGEIEPAADRIDYVEVADADTLQPYGPDELVPDRVLLALAARFGQARLIDNVVLGEDPAPAAGSEA
ncbi:MAG: pantoate--beta-alanine ligase [Myxococcota bacterium]